MAFAARVRAGVYDTIPRDIRFSFAFELELLFFLEQKTLLGWTTVGFFLAGGVAVFSSLRVCYGLGALEGWLFLFFFSFEDKGGRTEELWSVNRWYNRIKPLFRPIQVAGFI